MEDYETTRQSCVEGGFPLPALRSGWLRLRERGRQQDKVAEGKRDEAVGGFRPPPHPRRLSQRSLQPTFFSRLWLAEGTAQTFQPQNYYYYSSLSSSSPPGEDQNPIRCCFDVMRGFSPLDYYSVPILWRARPTDVTFATPTTTCTYYYW